MSNEKFIRTRYLRSLEKFATSIIKALKRSDFEAQKFALLVEKNQQILAKIEPAPLFDAYPKALLAFVNLSIEKCQEPNAQSTLLRAANALDKFKKAREYKRNKNDKNFDD